MKRKVDEQAHAAVLEEGELFFFYRPVKTREIPGGSRNMARFFMVMHPLRHSRYRLIALGKEQPSAFEDGGPRLKASIDKVLSTLDELRAELIDPEHRAGNPGKWIRPEAVMAAEGIYALLKYRDNTHLIYALDYPVRQSGFLEEMGVSQEGGYIANVRNPETGGNGRHSGFPGHLLERFRGRDLIPVDPVEFLDEVGAEMVLTDAMRDPEEDMNLEFNARNGSRTSDH